VRLSHLISDGSPPTLKIAPLPSIIVPSSLGLQPLVYDYINLDKDVGYCIFEYVLGK
jgi:hypothetical protein